MKLRDFTVLFLFFSFIYFVVSCSTYVMKTFAAETYTRGFCYESATVDGVKKILICEDNRQRCYARQLRRGDWSFTCKDVNRNKGVVDET